MVFLAQEGLTWQGVSIMTISLLLVSSLTVFCIFKLFKTRNH
ncbi:hypothetical protein LEP1GSC016_0115 [Leptospira borgpetersenii serovar Hardjo-bovis str. Sponselee]|uniref:Uncharacterized protein n=1 Tax=Leptospira borgpetersenii serovar Hardjo-bovis str. Sponselee TaxID=1303729 RepID=M6BCP7_LEPBO|nr:hypothetical protein [Leptospira borgpetersenii]EMJ77309.1 hypothetical protein LEP1GSC016_0115 [Leptospira borgpetersenii serovar Hardjo-bovis str. Sponselee]UYM83751.1 hypothetical protein MY148_09335 [Leptospira borgpetersenii]